MEACSSAPTGFQMPTSGFPKISALASRHSSSAFFSSSSSFKQLQTVSSPCVSLSSPTHNNFSVEKKHRKACPSRLAYTHLRFLVERLQWIFWLQTRRQCQLDCHDSPATWSNASQWATLMSLRCCCFRGLWLPLTSTVNLLNGCVGPNCQRDVPPTK